jgi:hypothetical protein
MTKTRTFLVHCLIGCVFGIVASSMIGHIFDRNALASWGGGVVLSYPATAGFFIVAMALWILAHDKTAT